MVPIPAEPQAELDIAYTQVAGHQRPRGQGPRLVAVARRPGGRGLQDLRATSSAARPQLGERGYPVQVNSEYPGENGIDLRRAVPGHGDAHVRRRRDHGRQGRVLVDRRPRGRGRQEGRQVRRRRAATPRPPGLPGLPGSSACRASPARSGGRRRGARQPNPLGALAGVVSGGAVSSVSKTTYGTDTVVSSAVTRIKGLSLLDGVITAGRRQGAVPDDEHADHLEERERRRPWRGSPIGGVPFGITEDGVVVSGEGQEIPGLPDDAGRGAGRARRLLHAAVGDQVLRRRHGQPGGPRAAGLDRLRRAAVALRQRPGRRHHRARCPTSSVSSRPPSAR